MIWKVFLIGTFGALGAVTRFAISTGFHKSLGGAFPVGTLAVNLLGCYLIGVIAQLARATEWITPEWRMAISVGFLGGLTTFSTFGWETFDLYESNQPVRALANVGANVVLGIVMVVAGVTTARWVGGTE